MKLAKKDDTPDGVAIYSLYGEKRDRIVLVHQYRYAIDDYIYEFPAGLVEKKEDYHDAAVRELREETGLKLELLNVPGYMEKPLYTTIGMTVNVVPWFMDMHQEPSVQMEKKTAEE